MKIYRQVKVSDRFPSKSNRYHTGKGFIYFNNRYNKFYDVELKITNDPDYWLEEIELPSDYDISFLEYDVLSQYNRGFIYGYNYMLDKIKGC